MDSSSNPAAIPRKPIRSYTRKPRLDPNPTIPAPPAQQAQHRPEPSTWTPPIPTFTPQDPDFSHQQPRLRAPRRTDEEKLADKFTAIDLFLLNSPFDSVGDFLSILFYQSSPWKTGSSWLYTHRDLYNSLVRARTRVHACVQSIKRLRGCAITSYV
ncbi:hypothetical protein B0H12DRAFT_1242758 [Mycena haematopus]|nr:hypothetical protein B0H12DRAFT_1242758 [Mycena haematopus]